MKNYALTQRVLPYLLKMKDSKPEPGRAASQRPLVEIAGLFFKLGCIAFGGPAAHIAMMEDEVVSLRRWISRAHFLDLVGATNLIPGPNSTEMTMHIGYERGGLRGLLVAGVSFIFPAATITLMLAWIYSAYGTVPELQPLLWGIKPAVLAIILSAVWKLGRKAVKNFALAVLGVSVAVAVLLGADEVLVLLLAGLFSLFVWAIYRSWKGAPAVMLLPGASLLPVVTQSSSNHSLLDLALFFLKVGATLYGSGYVLVAYLQGGLVEQLGWLTQEQLIDAIAIGQFTPGPVLTTATFVGYLLAGIPGAVIATLSIFMPSFIFVLFLNPLIPKMRRSPWLSIFLDAVNVSAVALMLAVLFLLSRSTITNWAGALIALTATVAIFRLKISSIWIVLGAGILGFLLHPLVIS